MTTKRTDAAFTGFGDDPQHAIKFSIDYAGDSLPFWKSGLRKNILKMSQSSSTVHQTEGRDDWMVTFRLSFASVDDFEILDDLVGYPPATLRYRWGLTNTAGGYHETLGDGVSYLTLPETVLESLDGRVLEPDGYCEATATFSRARVVNAYYGFSLYAEDLP